MVPCDLGTRKLLANMQPDFIIGQKHDRQLYIGNLPLGLTSDRLMHIVNRTLAVSAGTFKYMPGVPVIGAWIAQDGHYGFIEFRNP